MKKSYILQDRNTSQIIHQSFNLELITILIKKQNLSGLLFECNEDGRIVRLIKDINVIH